jgi:hypothetical protein
MSSGLESIGREFSNFPKSIEVRLPDGGVTCPIRLIDVNVQKM